MINIINYTVNKFKIKIAGIRYLILRQYLKNLKLYSYFFGKQSLFSKIGKQLLFF